MEFFLLWADELDDAFGAVRHLAPRILGFIVALVLFALTGLTVVFAPNAALVGLALLLSASLIELIRRRRIGLLDEHAG